MQRNANILISGANGFLGKALMRSFEGHPFINVLGVVRTKNHAVKSNYITIGDINKNTDWSEVLTEQDVVIHTAARTHIINDRSLHPYDAYERVNVGGTLSLAKQAAESGVKRFIFISSIKVLGEETLPGESFNHQSNPDPADDYSQSKYYAEKQLLAISKEKGMEVVIIRPPLIYGQNAKGNFAQMIKLIKTAMPLPLGTVENKRSLIGLGNLVDLIHTCIDHPNAAGQVLLVSDGKDLSTTELLKATALAMNVKLKLFWVPQGMLLFVFKCLGRGQMIHRLFGSLQVDHSRTCELLDWQPPYTVAEGLAHCFSEGNQND